MGAREVMQRDLPELRLRPADRPDKSDSPATLSRGQSARPANPVPALATVSAAAQNDPLANLGISALRYHSGRPSR